jgi:hypothetical protein
MHFVADHRDSLPGDSPTEKSKAAGKQWRELSESEKKVLFLPISFLVMVLMPRSRMSNLPLKRRKSMMQSTSFTRSRWSVVLQSSSVT